MSYGRIISADSHFVEPPDVFTQRMPKKYGDRIPHQQRMEQGDAWVIPGSAPFPYGLVQCGGLPPEEYRLWIRWDEVRPETHDLDARIAGQNKSGVGAEVMYPSPRIGIGMFGNDKDPEFLLDMVRAYNDWVSDYCAAHPDRFIGLAMAPSGGGTAAAIKECERALKLPGIKGILLHKYPTDGQRLRPEDDGLFKFCADAGVPVHIHVGLVGSESSTPRQAHEFTGAFTGCYRFYDPPIRMSEMIYTGLLDRVPDLKMVWAEVDVGWVGYLMEQLDDRIARQNPANRIKIKHPPSYYFRTNFFYTVVKDAYGIRNRDAVGASQILWSSDFPHATCDYPDFAGAIKHDFKGVPEGELKMMLSGNAAKLYGLSGY